MLRDGKTMQNILFSTFSASCFRQRDLSCVNQTLGNNEIYSECVTIDSTIWNIKQLPLSNPLNKLHVRQDKDKRCKCNTANSKSELFACFIISKWTQWLLAAWTFLSAGIQCWGTNTRNSFTGTRPQRITQTEGNFHQHSHKARHASHKSMI